MGSQPRGKNTQLVERPETAGIGFLRFEVSDLSDVENGLSGADLGKVEKGEIERIVKFLELRDPSGNEISFVQRLF